MRTSSKIFTTFIFLLTILICQPFIKNQAFSSDSSTNGAGQNNVYSVVSEFYRWYLHTLASNTEPSRDKLHLSRYLSTSLLNKLAHLKTAPDDDYFIKAQDYLEDWESNIVVSDVKIGTQTASAMVTLGAKASSKHRLVVNCVNEGHTWLISAVKLQGEK